MPDTTRIAAALADRCVIEREIGAGGMATVYLARDRKHDRDVALKILRADLSAVLGGDRFLNEVRITARLDHPHILTLIDSGEADGIFYYVLPYVRGESLRSKLEREKQLGLDEALSITRQIGSALDYAHQQGVVHRDIKPENILLHEGEAMLADFGIALAVKEAGGNRLTETGLSLGTPQYMSPEQATGDRTLDARSDVYSLAAVTYEMIAGEPPVTGATAQVMIAKLMTERPTRLRIVRDTVPEGVDNAVAKALAKVPADRFPRAGDFVQALSASMRPSAAQRRPSGLPRWVLPVTFGLVVLFVSAAWWVSQRRQAPPAAGVSLRDRRQLTFTGAVIAPAISPDGKQLAYITKTCSTAACTYALLVQDVGGTATRVVLDGATAGYFVSWSADRRNLLFAGTVGGHYGSFLVSALGGPPRFLGTGTADFFGGGDSLLLAPPVKADSVFWIRVATLDGNIHDSIRVHGPAEAITGVVAVPGTALFVAELNQGARAIWRVIDRHGAVLSQTENECSCEGFVDRGAIWLDINRPGRTPVIVRRALDSSGHIGARADTMYSGVHGVFSVTSDGGSLVIGEGTYENSVWALDMADALHGRFPESRRLARSSSELRGLVSPDGARVLLRRRVPSTGGREETRLAVLPFGGGTESAVNGLGDVDTGFWSDSVTIGFSGHSSGGGIHFGQVDVKSGAQRNGLDLPDSSVTDFDPLPDGWIWISANGRVITVRQGSRTRDMKMPDWYNFLTGVDVSADGRHFAVTGWNKATFDTIGIDVGSIDSLVTRRWFAGFGEQGSGFLMPDGTLLVNLYRTQDFASIFRVRSAGRPELVGSVPRPITSLTTANDSRHVVLVTHEYHGDAWMSSVVRP